MTFEDHVSLYADRNNLTNQDAEFMIGLLREAVQDERDACAAVAVNLNVKNYGLAPMDVREAIATAIRNRNC